MKTSPLGLALATSAFFWFGAAHAAGGLQLRNEVFQEIEVIGADGKPEHKTVPAATIVPGSEVFYVISYRNMGDKPADSVAITNPVPAELEYVSVLGPGPANQISVDGGKQYGALSSLSVTGADGKSRPAEAADVTHVRWMLNAALAPGDGGSVSFKARLK
ncbi:MAG: hypothetical protein HW392_602 [Steroidobacteraceae bacterium]|nr:hypothetical protein [Steroidobacteraceae bacterium]